ncbi:hypothetical protein EDB80DRAFT_691079 [Ilyonectria destructans]|nr:hypothetical protein EDB80DRAFT_691079 [Ilyonectria destructans]
MRRGDRRKKKEKKKKRTAHSRGGSANQLLRVSQRQAGYEEDSGVWEELVESLAFLSKKSAAEIKGRPLRVVLLSVFPSSATVLGQGTTESRATVVRMEKKPMYLSTCTSVQRKMPSAAFRHPGPGPVGGAGGGERGS